MVVLLLLQVRVLFDLGLVEAVDDGVFPLGNEHFLDLGKSASGVLEVKRMSDLLVVLEADLAGRHAAVLLKVGPGGVDYGDVVLLVT